jgi:uncharacterized protein (TIGR03790 family)
MIYEERRINIFSRRRTGVGKAASGLLLAGLFLVTGFVAGMVSVRVCWSLEPAGILVVYNQNVPDSLPLARYYMEKRGIPQENLLGISVTDQEECHRGEYESKIALPIRNFLEKRKAARQPLHCIVTLYGVPLAIKDTPLNIKEKAFLMDLQGQVRLLRFRLENEQGEKKEERKSLKGKIERLKRQLVVMGKMNKAAAVDSELALVRIAEYSLLGWLPNPHYLGYRSKKLKKVAEQVMMVSRLDGPSVQVVRRIIDDSLIAETAGLRGKAYFDARWPDPGKKKLSGFASFDRLLHRAAKNVKKSGAMKVVLDEKAALFQPGDCPEAALYCGWYSLARYVDAFEWVPGAVGYHIASLECTTLKKPESTVWCKVMLEKGVAATIGPVGEPYVETFPPPDLFFRLLVEGRLTLVECFARSNPYLSWKMVLIGDPLYRPFRYRAASDSEKKRLAFSFKIG